MKKLIIKWALNQIRELYNQNKLDNWHTDKDYGIEDIVEAKYSDTEILIAIKRKVRKRAFFRRLLIKLLKKGEI